MASSWRCLPRNGSTSHSGRTALSRVKKVSRKAGGREDLFDSGGLNVVASICWDVMVLLIDHMQKSVEVMM